MAPSVALVIHRCASVSSTQDEARRWVEAGVARAGHVIVADEQTEGRGRHGRVWLSPRGGLYATYVVSPHPQIAVVAGMAVHRSLHQFGVPAALKWPNDLLIEGRKLAGILIESLETEKLVLVGVGVNLEEAPLETAISLRAAGGNVGRGELIATIGRGLQFLATEEDLLCEYRAALSTLGESVRIDLGENRSPIEGTATDVDSNGRLIVRTIDGDHVVSAGDCIHLRSEAG